MSKRPFLRTNFGLINQSQFNKSEITAYTEGGRKSFSIVQIDKGEFNATSVDINFWKEILKIHGCNRKIYFKAIGSKTSGDELTQRIIDGKVTNTLIFKDKDLDNYLEKYIPHPSIIYTKGYSWENDVFTKENIVQIISDYIFDEVPLNHKLLIEKNFKDLEKIGDKLLRLELIFRSHGIRFLTNISGEELIKNGEINIDSLIRKIKKIALNNDIQRPFKYIKVRHSFNFYQDCYGKIFESISYHLTVSILKELIDIKNFSKDIFQRNALRIFFNTLKENKDTYYQTVAENINAA